MNLRSILYGALTRIAFVAAAALLMTAQASAEVQPARWSSLSLTFFAANRRRRPQRQH